MTDSQTDASIESRLPLNDGALRSTVFALALPVLLEQFLNFLVGFYDTFLSGQISSAATTAIGLSAYVGWLASMLFGFVAAGTTALVARNFGARDYETANRVTNRSMALSSIMGVTAFLMIFLAAPGFAALLNLSGEARPIAIRYLRIDGFGHVFTSVSLVGAAALRGAGDMRTPFWILGCVSLLNLIFSTLFVFGLGFVPPMGVDGIVFGTVLSRFFGGLWMVVALAQGVSGLRLLPKELRLRGKTVGRILNIGIPAAADGAVMWIGHFLFLMIVSRINAGEGQSATFAAHVIGIRVEAITYLPAVAWGAAAATLVGQSLGAHNADSARRSGNEAALQCSLLAIVISAVFFFGAGAIYHVMHQEPQVREIGVPAFRMLAFFQIPLVLGIVFNSALRGAGDTRFPLLVTLVSAFLVRVPAAYVFGIVLDGGLFGAWIGMCADMALRAILIAWRYASGVWIHVRV